MLKIILRLKSITLNSYHEKNKNNFFSATEEYGLIYPFLKIFSKNKNYEVKFIVAGSHLEKKFGYSINEIKKDKINVFKRIKVPLKTNELGNAAFYFSKWQNKINLLLNNNPADLIFLSQIDLKLWHSLLQHI